MKKLLLMSFESSCGFLNPICWLSAYYKGTQQILVGYIYIIPVNKIYSKFNPCAMLKILITVLVNKHYLWMFLAILSQKPRYISADQRGLYQFGRKKEKNLKCFWKIVTPCVSKVSRF